MNLADTIREMACAIEKNDVAELRRKYGINLLGIKMTINAIKNEEVKDELIDALLRRINKL